LLVGPRQVGKTTLAKTLMADYPRAQYFNFVEMLRERVGSPVTLASIARDLQVSSTTLAKYLDILEALYVVFTVRPYHRSIARDPQGVQSLFLRHRAGDRGRRRALRECLRGNASEAR